MISSQLSSDTYLTSLNAEYANVSTLKFSPQYETQFHTYRRDSFLQQEHSMVLIGAVVYTCFVLTDVAVLPPEYLPYVIAGRMVISALLFLLYYFMQIAKNMWVRQRVFYLLSFIILLVPVHIATTSYFLPQPYNMTYMLGIVQIYIVVPALFKPHSKLCFFTMLCMLLITCYTLFFGHQTPLMTNNENINEMISLYPVAFSSFLAGLVLISAYLAYSFEKILRKNWLDNAITKYHSQHLENLSEQLLMLSHKDELTQLSNRRHFQEVFEDEMARTQRSMQPLSLLMLDVDSFKSYNDTYGHQAGDDCLRQVAQCLDNQCQRLMDLPARFGGEEFMILLPNTDAKGAMHMAEGIRGAIEALDMVHEGSQFGKVTVSLGVTTIAGGKAVSMDTIVMQADNALYTAKTSGRNCCKMYLVQSVAV